MANNLPLDSPRASTLTRTSVTAAAGLALTAGLPLAHAALPVPGASLSNEFRVNSHTAGDQVSPVIAADAAGNYVVVWEDDSGADGDGDGIFAQRYDKNGAPLGSEFQVNSTSAGRQDTPAVAMDAAGDFVVVWTDYSGADSDGYGIFAQRYDKEGVALGGEIPINATSAGNQSSPAVAADAAGDFVVAWQGAGPDDYGIFAQRYRADGAKLGGEIPVNTYTTSNQTSPAVAMNVDGDFVVVWESDGQDGDKYGIFAQRYKASGASDGSEIPINADTSNSQSNPAIAMDAAGDFVVAWQDENGIDQSGVFARVYDAAGNAAGGGFSLNTFTKGFQTVPAIAMDADGDFVAVWQTKYEEDGTGSYGIATRRFKADGKTDGTEFVVNTAITGNQRNPAVAMDAAGDFVVSWTDEGGADGDGLGVFARRYARDSSLDLKANLAVAPADTVEPGGDLTLTATIANVEAPSTLTGNVTIDNALTTASGLTATLTLPDNVTFGKATGTHWTCPAAPAKDGTLTCTYDASLAATSETGNLTVSLTASDTDDTQLAFTNTVFGAQPDTATDNNTASTSVTIKAPPPDDNSDNGGSDSGGGAGSGGTSPTASSGGGGGGFGWLGLGLLGWIGLRRRRPG